MLFKMLRSCPPIGDVSDRIRRTSLNRKDLSCDLNKEDTEEKEMFSVTWCVWFFGSLNNML